MITYYLKLALRNQARNKLFFFVNILGLAIGFATSLLIINYVCFEFNFDKMHSKRDRIYRVESQFFEGNVLTDNWATSSFGYGSAIKSEMSLVEDFVRIGVHNSEQVVAYREKRYRETAIVYVDPSFFKIFDFKLKTGDARDQLVRPNTVVITERVAQQFFGNENPIGKMLTFSSGASFNDCEVTGVMDDFPKNSHVRYNFLISYESLPDWQRNFWYWHEAYTYLLLSPGKDPKEVEAGFPAMTGKYKTAEALRNKKWGVSLVPLQQIHFTPQKQYEKESKGNKTSLVTLIVIALAILISAWINYINLTTIQGMERAREVGIRKVSGAFRVQIISQFLAESAIINLMAVLISAVLIFLAKPLFNQLTGNEADLFILRVPLFWFSAFAVLVVGILISGLYPAIVISRINPSVILKGNFLNTGSGVVMRRVLVVFQFAASLFLICGTFIIYKQVRFMQKQDLGVQIDNTIVLKFPVSRNDLENQVAMFARNLQQQPGIKSVTVSGSVPGAEVASSGSNRLQGDGNEQHRLYEMLTVDDQFAETFDLKLLAGRTFRQGYGNERENILINESALISLGLKNPEEAIGKKVLLEGEAEPVNIIGVLQNWHQRGLSYSYTPIMFINNGRLSWVRPKYIAVKTTQTNPTGVIEQLQTTWKNYFPESTFDYFYLNGYYSDQYKADKKFGQIVSVFTLLAFFISGMGLWALTSFTASRKIKEVGVRKVLGAPAHSIFFLFSNEIFVLLMVALLIASPLSVVVMKNWLMNYAFRTNIDFWIYFSGGTLTLLIALITVSWQSWKAATRNPVEALRYE
ncbi:MAG: ABC transporter permease [Prolixibacteraceae bacterium]|nr:ABC transporter permease [Prolixibacteraceae bacterium]